MGADTEVTPWPTAARSSIRGQAFEERLPFFVGVIVTTGFLWERPWPRMTRHRHRPLLIVIKEIGKTRDLPSAAIEQWT
ncbi:hypothetical protein DW68_023005 [Ectopseudomonas mendocina S5.2]|uniref:Transposase n=1 Tax=Ectopseudomonas mendocina S5.2 TaxID=1225174 RepID=A0ABN4J047_ECTME|nr:hypothetical protein DW68_023005 [Pseudomonas mendocina S5.2]